MPTDVAEPSPLRHAFDKLAGLWDPLNLHVVLDRYRHRRGAKAFAVRQLAIFLLTARRLRDDEIARRAASLTYFSLLSLVPVLAVAFALFEAFGGLKAAEEPLKQFILENLAVGTEEQVAAYLDTFIGNVNTGAIAGVGVLVLFYSAVGLLTNVERSFNRIWGVERMRPLALRIAIYWCIVTLAPPLLGVSLSVSARLRNSEFAQAAGQWLPLGLGNLLLAVLADLAISAAFVFVYLIVPNVKVRLRHAVVGGIVAGLLWTAGKAMFLTLTETSAKYSAIYGALSALPLLMLWIYYSWLIVLFGVVYTYANQTVSSRSLQIGAMRVSGRSRVQLAARLIAVIARAFRHGEDAPDADRLAEATGAPITMVQRILSPLLRRKIVRELAVDEGGGYVPHHDLAEITLADVVRALEEDGDALELIDDRGAAGLESLLAEAEAARRAVLERESLRTLSSGGVGEPD